MALEDCRDLYLDLMGRCLLNTIYEDPSIDPWSGRRFSAEKRERGLDWPAVAHSMIGVQRMRNLRQLAETVLKEGIPGDFIETGVWRGGACIMMRAVLKAYGDRTRKVWVADSFAGLPPPDAARYPADARDRHHEFGELAVSLEQVRENFSRYDLLDEQVCFLKGWFKDTLPVAPIESLALLRLDGDMYESTLDGFQALYHKLSVGGFLIVDDYGAVPACAQAVADFRARWGIDEEIVPIDGVGVYWRKRKQIAVPGGSSPPVKAAPAVPTQARRGFHVTLISPPNYSHSDALLELAHTLVEGLNEAGYPCLFSRPSGQDPTAFQAGSFGTTIVLGAHVLGDRAATLLPPDCVLFNSEQLSEDSPWLTPALKDLLLRCETWDYSARNVAFLTQMGARARQVPIGYAPGLARIPAAAEQDIDVLFYGSMNERRARIIDALRAHGLRVEAVFNCYGADRDALIARARLVLNLHYYDAKIFEIVRVSYLLTNRKAVVAEVDPDTEIDEHFRDAVAGVPYDQLVDTCLRLLQDDAARDQLAQRGLERMRARPMSTCLQAALEQPPAAPAQANATPLPRVINLGSGKSYQAEQLNIDINPYWQPDILADLSQAGALERRHASPRFGELQLPQGYFDRIVALDVLEHVPDLVTLMGHCLALLREGGEFFIRVPYELSYGAWQDPTHVRAFNERSWLYYTDWFWYLGWQTARFDVVSLEMAPSPFGVQLQNEHNLPASLLPMQPRAIDHMDVLLRKRALTDAEQQTVAQYLQRPARFAAP